MSEPIQFKNLRKGGQWPVLQALLGRIACIARECGLLLQTD